MSAAFVARPYGTRFVVVNKTGGVLATFEAEPQAREWAAYMNGRADAARQQSDQGAEMEPQTETGKSLADGEQDGMTEMIVQIENEAQALVAPRAVRLSWIALPSLEVNISVIVLDGKALVTKDTLDLMAESIRTSEIASEEDDAAYADSILATIQRPDGLYDVTDEPALADELIEYGIGRASDFEASL